MVKFVSIYAVQLALRERSLWALCAALSTERPVLFGPNLRVLRSDARSDTHSGASTLDQVGGKFSQVIQVMRVKPPKRAPFSHDSSFFSRSLQAAFPNSDGDSPSWGFLACHWHSTTRFHSGLTNAMPIPFHKPVSTYVPLVHCFGDSVLSPVRRASIVFWGDHAPLVSPRGSVSRRFNALDLLAGAGGGEVLFRVSSFVSLTHQRRCDHYHSCAFEFCIAEELPRFPRSNPLYLGLVGVGGLRRVGVCTTPCSVASAPVVSLLVLWCLRLWLASVGRGPCCSLVGATCFRATSLHSVYVLRLSFIAGFFGVCYVFPWVLALRLFSFLVAVSLLALPLWLVRGLGLGGRVPFSWRLLAMTEDDKKEAAEVLELLARVHAGDMRAFESLFKRYCRRVTSFVHFGLVPQYHDLVPEIVNETFFVFWEKPKLYRGDCRFSTLLFSIARNKRLSALRVEAPHSHEDLEDVPEPCDQSASAPDQLSRVEALNRCLARLPALQRETIWLAHVEGASQAEIAEIMGVPSVETVKSRVRLGMKRLRPCIELALGGTPRDLMQERNRDDRAF